MSLKEIIERFALVSGLEMKEVSQYLTILTDCKAFFEARLIGEPDAADLHRAEHACAVYALYKISMMCRIEGLSSFKVGDVQFGLEVTEHAAEKLWAAERESISDIVDVDGDFSFRGVRI